MQSFSSFLHITHHIKKKVGQEEKKMVYLLAAAGIIAIGIALVYKTTVIANQPRNYENELGSKKLLQVADEIENVCGERFVIPKDKSDSFNYQFVHSEDPTQAYFIIKGKQYFIQPLMLQATVTRQSS